MDTNKIRIRLKIIKIIIFFAIIRVYHFTNIHILVVVNYGQLTYKLSLIILRLKKIKSLNLWQFSNFECISFSVILGTDNSAPVASPAVSPAASPAASPSASPSHSNSPPRPPAIIRYDSKFTVTWTLTHLLSPDS